MGFMLLFRKLISSFVLFASLGVSNLDSSKTYKAFPYNKDNGLKSKSESKSSFSFRFIKHGIYSNK